MTKLLDLLEEECKLTRYHPAPFFRGNGCTSGKTNRRQPRSIERAWLGTYLLELTKFEGRCTVTLTDESKGYSKILARSTGLDQAEAEQMYDKTYGVVSGLGKLLV